MLSNKQADMQTTWGLRVNEWRCHY